MYVLVTDFKGHWDNISRSSYPTSWLPSSELKDGADAIFLRLDEKGGHVQRGWRGIVHDIRRENKTTYFELNIDSELDASDLCHYEHFRSSGWFEDSSAALPSKEEQYRSADSASPATLDAGSTGTVKVELSGEKTCTIRFMNDYRRVTLARKGPAS